MVRRTPPEFEVEIENLVFGGEGLGYFNSKPVFVYGVLPREKVIVRPVRVRGKFIKAALVKIIKASENRREARDEHFLTSSPWEVIPEELQRDLKVELTKNMWRKLAKQLPSPELKITPSIDNWHYRNKMEFSFVEEGDKISLAFHQRYYHNRFYALKESALATSVMNRCAQTVITEINKRKISLEVLKNLLLRFSFLNNTCLAVLYVKDNKFETFHIQDKSLSGWQIVYSNPKSPAAVTDEILLEQGDLFLTEKIKDRKFIYGYENFFQVNPPTFEKIIDFIKGNISGGRSLLDLYAGVGVIGISLSDFFKKVICVESDNQASVLTERNASQNGLLNIEIVSGQSEKQDLSYLLKRADYLIVDPPRSGLHPKVVKAIRDFGPNNFIYISCNPSTQARDWALWRGIYDTQAWRLFDMYPQTPHIESVLVMKRK